MVSGSWLLKSSNDLVMACGRALGALAVSNGDYRA